MRCGAIACSIATGQRGGCGGIFCLLIPFDRFGLADQRMFQHFGYVFDGNDGQPFLHVIRDLRQVLCVLDRDKNLLAPTTRRPARRLAHAADSPRSPAHDHRPRHPEKHPRVRTR